MSRPHRSNQRRTYQFRIRTVLLLLVAFGSCLAFPVNRLHQKSRERQIIASLRVSAEAIPLYDWYVENYLDGGAPDSDVSTWPGPVWARKIVGDDFFSRLEGIDFAENQRFTHDADLELVAQLRGLRRLYLGYADLSDTGVGRIWELTSLERLDLGFSRPSEAALSGLEGLEKLKALRLNSDGATDETLACIGHLSRLEALYIKGTGITDEGLMHLGKLKRLRSLALSLPNVTATGLRHLCVLRGLEKLDLHGMRGALTTDVVKELKQALAGCDFSL